LSTFFYDVFYNVIIRIDSPFDSGRIENISIHEDISISKFVIPDLFRNLPLALSLSLAGRGESEGVAAGVHPLLDTGRE